MNILCTGGLGFIGSHIVWELRFLGHRVDIFDRGYAFQLLQPSYDCIVHCAANLFDHFEENVALTFKLCIRYPDTHMIFTSSAAVYGESTYAKEDDVLHPFGAYGKAKYLEERIIQEYVPKYTILRLGNVYGYDSDHGIIAKIFREKDITIPYPDHVRDFIHVDDVVKSIIYSIEYPQTWNGILNIATGKGTSIDQVWKKLRPQETMCSGNTDIDEIEVSILDISKAKNVGFSPRTFL